MRGSLDKRDALAARALDEELRRSATEASMARSRITVVELEDLRLSYDISSSVSLRASGPEERANDPPEGFVAIYEPTMQQGLRLSMHPFFREGRSGERLLTVPIKCITRRKGSSSLAETRSLYRRIPFPMCPFFADSGNLVYIFLYLCTSFVAPDLMCYFFFADCGKPPIPKRNRAFKFKGVLVLRVARPASWDGSSAQASQQEASGPSQESQDVTPSSVIPPLRPEVDANVPSRPSSSSNLHIDSTTSRDKGKKVVEGAEEVPSQKWKAPAATNGLMRDACKARRTEKGRRSSPSLDGEPEGASNSAPSVSQNRRIRISERREELSASVMEILPAYPSIVAANVHRYWTSSWEKVAEVATVLEWLQLAEVNLVRGLVLAKDIFSAFVSFDAEDSKSKKLSEDLKVMGLEKAQLESDKRDLQFKLDLARDQKKAVEASQKHVEEDQSLADEAQKLADDQNLAAETALAAANSSSEAAAADNERSLSAMRLELEKIKVEQADAEARAVEAYQDAFVDTPEYQDLAQRLMTVGGEQLVERIMEAHPEWDLSFLREAPAEAHVSEAVPGDTFGRDEGPSRADP
ncbi:Uncharacterized protein Adt_14856 [Abeliophyllum distichum]|uniref:Uncharacterized protein n=1 Tax=Abeliophyllum distichum TaxID=126358 RepID=A0ABD1U0U3_9LAMI